MQVNLYVFPTYYGAIEYFSETIKDKGNSIDDRNVVFTEEKNTLLCEKALLDAVGGSFNTEILSMKKYLRKIKQADNMLSKQGSVMLCRKIIKDNAEFFTGLKLSKLKTLAPTVYEQIAQLKSAKVSFSDLNALPLESGLLKEKLKDLSLIYEEYEKALKESGKIDQNNYLSALPEIIDGGSLNDADVYFLAYQSFTKQETEVILSCIKNARSVTAFLVGGENKFLYTNEAVDKFIKTASLAGAKVNKIYPKVSLNREGKIISEKMFNPSLINKKKEDTDNLYFYQSKTKKDEFTKIAKIIKYNVLSGKMRYLDAQVGAKSEDYSIIKEVFDEYEIPCFIDEKKVLADHFAVKTLIDFFNCFYYGYDKKDYIKLCASPLLSFDKDFSDGYVNYILKTGLRRGGALKPFENKDGDKNVNLYEDFRNKLAGLFSLLKKEDFTSNYVAAAEKFFETFSAESVLSKYEEYFRQGGNLEEAAYISRVLPAIKDVLQEVKAVIPYQKIELDEFVSIIKAGFTATDISVLPQYVDAVFVGDYKELRLIKTDYLFVSGLSSAVPNAKSDVAFISDDDIKKIENLNVYIEPKIKAINLRERENVGLALFSFNKKAYYSFSVQKPDGKAEGKSEIFSYLFGSFSKNGKDSDFTDWDNYEDRGIPNYDVLGYMTEAQGEKQFAEDVRRFMLGENNNVAIFSSFLSALPSGEQDNLNKTLSELNTEVIKNLKNNKDIIFTNRKLSASLLENYFSCPLKNFYDNAVMLKERDVLEPQPMDIGNFLHKVLEKITPKIPEVSSETQFSELAEKTAEEISLDKEYEKYAKIPAFKSVFKRLIREAKAVSKKLYYQIKNSGFTVLGEEIKFGKGKDFDAISLNVDGKEMLIEGKVDRVDTAEDYVRIIDYKSGGREFSLNTLYSGENLQLFLYMNAFTKDKKAAGIYYFPVNNEYVKEGESIPVSLNGRTLDDDNIIRLSDTTLGEDGSESKILPITYSKKNDKLKITISSKASLTEEEMNACVKYSVLVSEKGAERLSLGAILASPIGDEQKTTCSFCEYLSLCPFIKDGTLKARKIKSVSVSDIQNSVSDDEEKE